MWGFVRICFLAEQKKAQRTQSHIVRLSVTIFHYELHHTIDPDF